MSQRILITRSAHQASALAEALRAAGLEPVLIPTIELAPPTSFATLDKAIASLGTFNWLLFTSANAVEAFAKRATALGAPYLDFEMWVKWHDTLIAAIGPATSKALELLGAKPTLIPAQAVAESLAAALVPYALQSDGTPTRFLLIRAESARDHLPDALRSAGAHVTIAPAYRTIIPRGSISAIQSLFSTEANHPQAITFTSSSAATNLLALLEASEMVLPPDILRISIGPITSKTLADLNLPPHAEASGATIPALAEAVRHAVSSIPT